MKLEEALKEIGLNEKEAKIYLAVLEIGRGTVQSISQKAETKRPNTYVVLEDLRKKGLVSLINESEKVTYTAESPKKILEAQQKKEKIMKENLPELLAIFNTQKEKPKVRFYESEDRLVDLYDDIFKSKKVDIFGSINSISASILDKIWWSLEKVRKNKIEVREVLQADKESIDYAKKYSSENHKIKIAPESVIFPSDNILYENKLVIFSYKDIPMAVVIESDDVATTYKSMFEIMWGNLE
ncbi:hypothetical protein A2442_01075 [Candidatus Campbellbacteria bacterium RIFOXYC2_FULL_35_25]|uniref:Transcription regulator TrmB N-terminal domain-containing protein n=1 Tax=Candidatus Campbellbacteria bacterium RIFOXYC2_FULL_35_25 TaxID=1797582 RepID=A0A1F5EIV9_9BACT|nr:MAG: hypothetical protein A2442_01075 [Candidatus Campbellbacteria bacterium RIFOXYC2_FULL_35_25]